LAEAVAGLGGVAVAVVQGEGDEEQARHPVEVIANGRVGVVEVAEAELRGIAEQEQAHETSRADRTAPG